MCVDTHIIFSIDFILALFLVVLDGLGIERGPVLWDDLYFRVRSQSSVEKFYIMLLIMQVHELPFLSTIPHSLPFFPLSPTPSLSSTIPHSLPFFHYPPLSPFLPPLSPFLSNIPSPPTLPHSPPRIIVVSCISVVTRIVLVVFSTCWRFVGWVIY